MTDANDWKDKARATLSEKASTTTGVVEKSIIGSVLAFLADLVTPYLNVAMYLTPVFLLTSLTCFILWRRNRAPSWGKWLKISAIASALSTVLFVYQLYVPAAKQKGVMATNIKAIEEIQSSLGLIDKKLTSIQEGIEKIADTSSAIEKNTAATVDELRAMRQQMIALSSNSGIVAAPKTQVDFYHNARIYAQRGEIDLAMKSYEGVFRFPLKFVDPIEDLLSLAVRIYGRPEARRYFTDKLKSNLPNEYYLFGLQKLSDTLLPEVQKFVLDGEPAFSPLLAQFVQLTKPDIGRTTFSNRRAFVFAQTEVRKAYESGKFQAFYLDQLRAERDAREAQISQDEIVKQVGFEQILKYPIWVTYEFEEGRPVRFNMKVFDILSKEREIEICYHNDARQRYCRTDFGKILVRGQVTDAGTARTGGRDGNAEVVNQFVFREMRESKYFCIDRVIYKDRDGLTVSLTADDLLIVSLSKRHQEMQQALETDCINDGDLPIIGR